MKSNYIATQLEPEDFREFGIRAATEGTSKSALLRGLVANFLKSKIASKPGTVRRKGGNFRKGGTI